MTPLDWAVVAGGLGASAWVVWYFFAAEPASVVAGQEAMIVVEGAYAPAVVRVQAGRPVRLVFDRRETSGCSEEVVFGDFGIRRFLPAHQKTTVEVTPPAAGTYEFTCGMGMMRGRIVAE
ncbi:cupredoxin domain-containing protein [Roseisolibacter sp. H3M3-2]|uniref:cupredoxin domain-containing protein n=1 Tax=Roseisolibacter sp. H3M3-2 TaxID=3031323 RepID=UPI0023DBE935|nr:cupredoxin domain-containing protein [Roseisolibacter sp. H3M3-2]MDF1504118.1 cupredoxin domain-containing protein [Roseisolibacter sp. H3M3-2]